MGKCKHPMGRTLSKTNYEQACMVCGKTEDEITIEHLMQRIAELEGKLARIQTACLMYPQDMTMLGAVTINIMTDYGKTPIEQALKEGE